MKMEGAENVKAGLKWYGSQGSELSWWPSQEKEGLLPSRVAKSLSIRHQLLYCSVALAHCCGLARFVMTASLLWCLCQQFEMALVLRACDRCKLSCTDTSKWKICWMRPVRRSQSLHHKCVPAAICQQRYRKLLQKNKCCKLLWVVGSQEAGGTSCCLFVPRF